jgi:hypothetical protein
MSRLQPVTSGMLAEVRRLAEQAIAERAPLAVTGITMLALVDGVDEWRKAYEDVLGLVEQLSDPWPFTSRQMQDYLDAASAALASGDPLPPVPVKEPNP